MFNYSDLRGEFHAEFVYESHTDIVEENNKIVNDGYDGLLNNIFIAHDPTFTFGGISLGTDVGDGTIEHPSPPTRESSGDDQIIVYTVNSKKITTIVAQSNVVMMAHVDGNELEGNRSMFTSATIRSADGRVLAYKRFGGQAISNLLAVNIRWTIYIEDTCNEYN